MPHATVNGQTLHYERQGDAGEPLVLVHGYSGDIADWRYQIEEFRSTHRVLALDHRGHGKSHAPADRDRYTIAEMVADVLGLVAEMGFERYHLVGHSMGGAISQEIALAHAETLLSLTLEDTGVGFTPGIGGIIEQWNKARHAMAEERGMAAVAELKLPFKPPPHQTEKRQAYERQRLAAMSVDAFIGASQGLSAWAGTKERARDIKTPTLVVCGELDPLLKAAHFLGREIPGAELVIIPEAGHSPQFERPELFNAALRRHLERNSERSQ